MRRSKYVCRIGACLLSESRGYAPCAESGIKHAISSLYRYAEEGRDDGGRVVHTEIRGGGDGGSVRCCVLI